MSILPATVSLYDFATSPKLYGSMKPKEENWFAWNVVFKVLSGLSLDRKELKFFDRVSGGLEYRRGKMPRNFTGIIGRKGGKSFDISRIASWRLLTFDFPLEIGETARNLIIAPNYRAGIIDIDFVEGLFDTHPRLREYVILRQGKLSKRTEQTAELKLTNRCSISLMPVSRVSGRGPSTWTLILDEAAHFKMDGRFSDDETFKSARPSMSRFGMDAAFFIISSPYHKEGLLYKQYQKYFGVRNDYVLVINGSSKEFNPTLSDDFLNQERIENGDEYFKREYLAQFVDAQSAAYSGDAIDEMVMRGTKEIPFNPEHEYFGLLDPSGLSEDSVWNDEFCAGVMHLEDWGDIQIPIVDVIRGWTANKGAEVRSTPRQAIDGSIELFRAYNIGEVNSDKFAGQWLTPAFEDAGFSYVKCELTKWDLYQELMPALNNNTIRIVDDEKTITQMKMMERTQRGGRERIDHAKGKKDDRANIVALANYIGQQKAVSTNIGFSWV